MDSLKQVGNRAPTTEQVRILPTPLSKQGEMMAFEKIDISHLTLQEMFDQICEHAAKQQCRSTSKAAGGCAYRGDHGTKDFAGIFIPDGKYSQSMEGISLIDVFVFKNRAQELFLSQMMSAHDHSDSVGNLKDYLNDYAEIWKLNPAKVSLIEHWDIEEVKPYRGDW